VVVLQILLFAPFMLRSRLLSLELFYWTRVSLVSLVLHLVLCFGKLGDELGPFCFDGDFLYFSVAFLRPCLRFWCTVLLFCWEFIEFIL